MTTWIDLTGWTLIHFLWQGTLIAIAAAVGLRLSRSASVRYALSCGALAVMVAAPLVTGWLVASRATLPPVIRSGAAQTALVAEPVAESVTVPPAAAATPSWPDAGPWSVTTASAMPAIVTLWLSGVLLLLGRMTGGCWRIRALQRRAFDEPVSRWQGAADSIARRLRLARPVFMVDSDRVDTPTVIGWLRPVVLLPVAAMTNLAPGQVEAILAHELAHVRRHDFIVNLLQSAAETLLFYHPAVWWISSRIRTEREHCCDDVAVEVCGDPVTYAAALTELAAWSLQRQTLAVAATGGPLLERVRRLLGLAGGGSAVHSTGTLKLGGLVLAVVFVGISVRAVAVAQVSDQAPDVPGGREYGPAAVNRFVGFELFPGPKTLPTDDPRDARAWDVTVEFASGSMPLVGFTGRSIIRQAYGLSGEPIVDAPAWLDEQTFDLTAASDASIAAGVSDPEALQAALRTMVEQRLGLVVHREQRNFPVYALVKANADGTLGPNLRASTSDCWDLGDGQARRFTRFCGIEDHLTGVSAERVTIDRFIEKLYRTPLSPDLPVVDRTGLAGTYDLSLRFGFLPFAALGAAHYRLGRILEPLGFRSLFTALPEQLGLRLERSTAPFDVLVIDRIEKPAS
jgi:uncharacterized protein (TIGR03435 family)